eukprot:392860_1
MTDNIPLELTNFFIRGGSIPLFQVFEVKSVIIDNTVFECILFNGTDIQKAIIVNQYHNLPSDSSMIRLNVNDIRMQNRCSCCSHHYTLIVYSYKIISFTKYIFKHDLSSILNPISIPILKSYPCPNNISSEFFKSCPLVQITDIMKIVKSETTCAREEKYREKYQIVLNDGYQIIHAVVSKVNYKKYDIIQPKEWIYTEKYVLEIARAKLMHTANNNAKIIGSPKPHWYMYRMIPTYDIFNRLWPLCAKNETSFHYFGCKQYCVHKQCINKLSNKQIVNETFATIQQNIDFWLDTTTLGDLFNLLHINIDNISDPQEFEEVIQKSICNNAANAVQSTCRQYSKNCALDFIILPKNYNQLIQAIKFFTQPKSTKAINHTLNCVLFKLVHFPLIIKYFMKYHLV